MDSERFALKCVAALVAGSAVVLSALVAEPAYAQLGQGNIVVGTSAGTDSFRVYDASSDTWSNGPGWERTFIQSIEFDNANGVSHNASGNLLGVNFGNSFTGFEVFNLATDGTSNSESVWSIVEATGGTRGMNPNGAWLSQRGGGLSVSPDNSYVAWGNFDTGQLWVHDYSAGATPGSGAGASISGARRTALGDGNGNAGTLNALAQSVTQGTAWLNDTTVVAFNGFGELITLDVSGHAGGTEDGTLAGFMPTEMTNWRVANSEVAFSAQTTDIEYNPLIDPNHIYASVTKAGTFESELFAFNYTPSTGAISLNRSISWSNPANAEREPREIAFDREGNLYFSGYAGGGTTDSNNLVMVLPNATDIAGWDEADVVVFFNTSINAGFNGMDVALGPDAPDGVLGDYNGNDVVDAADYVLWRKGGPLLNEGDNPGTVDQGDYNFWRARFGATSGSGAALTSAAVPEPLSVTLIVLGIVSTSWTRRGR